MPLEKETMTDIFTDVSVEGLRRVSAAHYFDSFTCFSVVPGVEVYQGKELIRVVTAGIPNGLNNAIVRCRLSPGIVADVIDETHAIFLQGALPIGSFAGRPAAGPGAAPDR
jgi:hypothetical protein